MSSRKKKSKNSSASDSYAIFEHAIPFLGAAQVLFEIASRDPSKFRCHLLFPSMVLSAFAAELLLKCLQHTHTKSFAREHRILALYNSLPTGDQLLLKRYVEETAAIDPLAAIHNAEMQDMSIDVKAIVTRCNRAFIKHRYHYEHNTWPTDENGLVSTTGINHLLMALRRLLNERNPDWQERSQRSDARERVKAIRVPASDSSPFVDEAPILGPSDEIPASPQDTSIDSYGVYLHATRFVEAAQVLAGLVSTGSPVFILPSIFLMSFAAELLLKCLSNDRIGWIPAGHSLVDLYSALPEEDRRAIMDRVNTTVAKDAYLHEVARLAKLAGVEPKSIQLDFESILRGCDHGFEGIRYHFDESARKGNPGIGLDNLCEAIHARIHHLRPDWPQRYAESAIVAAAPIK